MMKQTFMKLNLSCRLFLIIIVLFLIPYLSLFSWAYRKAEIIIRTKAQSLEKENLSQTRNDIENLCLNIAKASDYLISLDHYGVLYRESEQKGYAYLKCWQYVDEQIQNANNALLNSSADISVLSKDRLLYSTLSYQKFRYQDFFREQVVSTFKKVFPYILVGVGIGAIIHNWIPESWIEAVLGGNNPFGVVLATLVGIPMYADIFGTIPVAEALLYKGAQLGTILSFMMAVTTLSLPSLIMLRKAVKPKLLALFIGICTIGIILVGYLFNAFQFLLI